MYERREDHRGRYYNCGDGKYYPSVTTWLKNVLDHSFVDHWRAAVGEAEADKTLKQAGERGDELHEYCEHYLKGEPFEPKFPTVKWMFATMKPHLDKITNIKGLELRMHSDKLQLAGTTDCIADYNGKPSVIDFKNSNNLRDKEDILGYFLQATVYSIMYHELYGVWHPNIVIIMALKQNRTVVYEEHIKNYIPLALELIKKFHKELKDK